MEKGTAAGTVDMNKDIKAYVKEVINLFDSMKITLRERQIVLLPLMKKPDSAIITEGVGADRTHWQMNWHYVIGVPEGEDISPGNMVLLGAEPYTFFLPVALKKLNPSVDAQLYTIKAYDILASTNGI